MNSIKERIQLVETKIKKTKSTLALWTQKIEKYSQDLENLTNQLQEIKNKVK